MNRLIRSLAALAVLFLLGSVIAPAGLARSSSAPAFPVKVATIMHFGKVLTNSKGHTLYYLKSEKDGKIHCSSGCTSVWPPLLLPKGGKVSKTIKGAPAHFATIKRPDGHTQITYNGWPLYTYSGDKGPDQTHGNGIAGVWFVTKTTLGKRVATKSSSGGY